ncbi:ATP-binding protein [Metabacillus fastidiosus]|uniref:ATP-binding protein n=1 Tax=Metabacillus fastidiosus TaxID=1458 RepID=UPI002DBF04D0|nr:ATP-binding protein [Metabacillus fastidiosus]MEC2075640.1 ATP-binding protein [Metabacillus fastidiosus]
MNHLEDTYVIIGGVHSLERAMNNLLGNIVSHINYLDKIFIQCYKEDNNVVFTVQDDFSLEDLQRVFEPLYHGELPRNRSTGRSGLGFSILQRITRLHSGESYHK